MSLFTVPAAAQPLVVLARVQGPGPVRVQALVLVLVQAPAQGRVALPRADWLPVEWPRAEWRPAVSSPARESALSPSWKGE
jgi:hypothetical protein